LWCRHLACNVRQAVRLHRNARWQCDKKMGADQDGSPALPGESFLFAARESAHCGAGILPAVEAGGTSAPQK
jgi:hypothetical protein